MLRDALFALALLTGCGSSNAVVADATDAATATDAPAADAPAARDVPAATDTPAAATDATPATDAAPAADAAVDLCAQPSPCRNDAPLTDMDIANCRASVTAQRGMPCEAENNAVGLCRARNIACGADGMTDFTMTAERFNAACMAVAMARETCCASPAAMGSANCI